MIMSFTPVNGIISYLRRIFRNTQMEVLNLVLIYLQNLMHADVTIHKEETDQVWFNDRGDYVHFIFSELGRTGR